MSLLPTSSAAERFAHIFHDLLASVIQYPDTLATLCRVSKSFHTIFTPILYRYLQIELGHHTPLHHLSSLLDPSKLGFTEEVHLTTPPGYRKDEVEDEKRVQSLDQLLQHTLKLKSFTLFGPAILGRFLQGDSSTGIIAEGRYGTILRPLIRLSQLSHLASVTIGNSYQGTEFETELPTFRNLLRFDIYGLVRTSEQNLNDIVETLIASPNLEYFGLSLAPQMYLDNIPLRGLIDNFEARQTEFNRHSRLQLSGLRLGFGTIPTIWDVGYPEGDSYLHKLTDLSFLKDLRLDNSNIMGHAQDFHIRNIDPNQFLMANSVQKLSVDILTVQALELIKLLRDVENSCLNELEVSKYFETLSPDENYGINSDDDDETDFNDSSQITPRYIYSLALERIGNHWRRLSIGSQVERNWIGNSRISSHAKDVLQNFITKCKGLEELSFPIIESQIELLKQTVMFKARKTLRAIFLPHDHLAELRPPFRIAYAIAKAGGEEQFNLNSAKVAREQEKLRLGLAGEIFKRNRELVASDGACLLQYVGIDIHVYTCLLTSPDAVESSSIFSMGEKMYHIVKLLVRQALEFEAVKRRYWERLARF